MTTLRRVPLVVLLIAAAAAACGGSSPSEPPGSGQPGLAGTAWRVVTVDGRQPAPGAAPMITFRELDVRGSGGCNTFGGGYTYDRAAGRLAFANLSMTAMACAEQPRNDFETAFFRTLAQATTVSFDPTGRLSLAGPTGQIVLVRDAPGAAASS